MAPPVSRRRALSGAAGIGLALPVLAACGDDGGASADGGGASESPTTTSAAPTSGPETPRTPSEPSTSEEPPVDGVAATADVPVGGGLVVAGREVVITQPARGDFKVFTAVCTHRGCLVDQVTDTIDCPCHGSTFDLATGEPTGGPAPSALDAVDFEISGDQVVLT